jgi:ADP-heptose:LPS heptosyltransferase
MKPSLPAYRSDNILFKAQLLARIFLAYVRRGPATGKQESPKTIAVIQSAQIGDIICTTPVFRAIKKSYPGARLIVLGRAINRETLAGNPDVDRYIVWDEDIRTLLPLLAEEHCDFGIVTTPNFLGVALLYLAGTTTIAAPVVRNGWSPYMTKPYKLILPLVIQKEHRIGSYVPREYLRLLEPIGIYTDDTKKYAYASDTARAKMRALLTPYREGGRLLVGLLSGAGNKIKQWPPERFATVAKHLIQRHSASVVVIGAPNEKPESDAFLKNMEDRRHVLDTTATLSLDEVKALVGELDMLLGVDTGPMFFAEAQDIPTLDLACNIDEREQAPNDGNFHIVVVPPGRSKAAPVLTMNPKLIDYEEAQRQVMSLTEDLVIVKADELIAKIKKR